MSLKKLVIVESPGKIHKIKQYLGDEYIVKASCGHIQDLDKSTLSIDVHDNFKPYYVINTDKKKIVNDLITVAKSCNDVILASDSDREGEYIAYSLASVLKLNNPKRIAFNEITKNAINKAVSNPTIINMNMVNAQQTRRLLDRLMGYLISPILKNYLDYDKPQSAGRVQSVVIKIINEKEKEIDQSISEPFLKTIGLFKFNKIKINSLLQYNSKLYIFKEESIANNFLNTINKSTIFKVNNVDENNIYKNPSPPFITSSLQQEASTKLHFNIKKTMDIAQKLYEDGYITYMRTDCPNISKDAINNIKKYIIDTYGDEYSDPKNYQSKNSNSQDAHECIRPTDIYKIDIEKNNEMNKLYSLIWKRTIASQMSQALIKVNNVKIDALIKNKSILLIEDKQLYFVSKFENIEFQGYLILYNNIKENDSENTESNTNIENICIKINDIVKFDKINIILEFTKPPLRYNESLLVKYLEKNGIGRPSTYASIISKVIEREYVEIKDIEGIKKESKIIELNNKFIIKEHMKEIILGREYKKIICTEKGIQVNNFLNEHFSSIINVKFSSELESHLDKIAIGEANWLNILKYFYDRFNPIIEKLNIDIKNNKKTNNEILLGTDDDNNNIYQGCGKYGPYLKITIDNKHKYTSINNKDLVNNMTIDIAKDLILFPKNLGKIKKETIFLYNGSYGYYIKYLGKNISIKEKNIDINNINLNFIQNKYLKNI